MKKQVKRWLTLAMAFALILGSINYNPMSANAKAVSPIQMESTVTGNDAGGIVPEGVEDVAGDIDTVSGDMVFEPGKALMFSMVRNARATESYTITVYPDALTHNWSATGITYEVSTDNKLKIDFGVANADSQWRLPETLDLANLEKVIFNVCDQSGKHNISTAYFAENSTTKIDTITNQADGTSYELIPETTTGEVSQLVFQAAGWDFAEGNTLTIESVVFTMKKTADETDKVHGTAPVTEQENYTITVYASALKHDWSKAGITNTLGTDNRLKIDFGVDSQDSRYDLTNGNGEALSIDLANVEKVTFNVCDQVGRHNIALSKDGTKAGDPIQNQTGSASFEMVPTVNTGTINEVVFQAAGWDYTADDTLTIESVVFTMKKTAEDQEDVAYGVEPAEIEQDLTTNITPEAANVIKFAQNSLS